jgi:tetratricopeptide (TPR) repeat protein
VAVADWRLVPRLPDAKQAERYCKDGLEHAGRALERDPEWAEALAIKAALQGLSLRFEPGSMMTVGAELEGNLQRALRLAPRNPRIRLIEGINTLHKPAFVGGGPEKAMPKLEQARELFASESRADSTAPGWGAEDACIWAGRCAAMLGDHDAARDYYRQALALNPANGWVRGTLLPDLEKSAAADSAGAGATHADSAGRAAPPRTRP